MFKKIIFWCEFPKQVNWKKAENLLKGLPIEVYVAVKTLKEYKNWKKKTKLKLNPWPILDKKDGYWFSGFTSKKNIDKLKQFKGLDIKVDLEPPLPKWRYRTYRLLNYGIKQLFRTGKNKDYLRKTIYDLTKKSKVEQVIGQSYIIANEFPLYKKYLEKQGIYIAPRKNMTKNLMCYTTFAGSFFRPFVRAYLKFFMKRIVKEDKNAMFSIGLIWHGILSDEGIYRDVNEFKQDLELVNKVGVKKIAIYSLEGILKRSKPEEWTKTIKQYL